MTNGNVSIRTGKHNSPSTSGRARAAAMHHQTVGHQLICVSHYRSAHMPKYYRLPRARTEGNSRSALFKYFKACSVSPSFKHFSANLIQRLLSSLFPSILQQHRNLKPSIEYITRNREQCRVATKPAAYPYRRDLGGSQIISLGTPIGNESLPKIIINDTISVLGPVLFVLFVNDIIYCADCSVTIKTFADDTKLNTVIVDDSSVANLQSSLDRIHRWSNHWQLKLSPTKCTVMLLCKPSDNYSLVDVNYSLCSSILPTVSSVTDLGVSYDSHLSFRPHINKIVSKASQRAKLIVLCRVLCFC